MGPEIRRAMILAAGQGTRMRPLTLTKPKPLVEVNGRTLLDQCIDRLKAAGVTEILVNARYLAEQIVAHCAARRDVKLTIQDERDVELDTGGALVRARPFFQDRPFITFNADSLWVEGMGSNLKRLMAVWDDARMDCLMLLAPTWNTIGEVGKGDFYMDGLGRLSRRETHRVTPFIWPGVQIVHPRFLDGAPAGKFSTNVLWDRAIEAGRLFGIRLDGRWMHIGTPDAIGEAEEYLRQLGR
jgi:N-acetyl-alpha-D-muramate 1-phosphate uridylyltransferase